MGSIIANTGAHGTGKITGILKKAEEYKIQHPEQSVMVHMESTAMSPYPINKTTTADSQMWIFTAHIKKELELLSRFDTVMSDRTPVDIIAYTRVAGFDSLSFAMLEMVRHHLWRYRRIIFRTIRKNPFCFPDGIREHQDDAFRQKIENTLMELYEILNCRVQYD